MRPSGVQAHAEMRFPDVALILPSVRASVGVARQMVLGMLDSADIADERVNEIAIAVTEATTNAVVHADAGEGEGEFTVDAWIDDAQLRVVVSDHGGGINPRISSETAGLGLGIPLMVAMADEATFARGPGGSTEVRLRFTWGTPEP